jgi:Trypsin-like peptidase domain
MKFFCRSVAMTAKVDVVLRSLRHTVDTAGSGAQRMRALQIIEQFEAASALPALGREMRLRSVIDKKSRAIRVDQLQNEANIRTWLGAAETLDFLRKQAAAVARQLYDGSTPRLWLKQAIDATCAVKVTAGSHIWKGTGFLVQTTPPVVMTNRHVVAGLLRPPHGPGMTIPAGSEIEVSFGNVPDSPLFMVESADVFAGPDMALLHLASPGPQVEAIALPDAGNSGEQPERVALIIGFPWGPKLKSEKEIFSDLIGMKMLSIGVLNFDVGSASFPNPGFAINWHNCATCGGFSGSALFTVDDGKLAALHFEGGALSATGQIGFANLAVDLRAVSVPLANPAPALPPLSGSGAPVLRTGPSAPHEAQWVGVTRTLSMQRDLPDQRDLPYLPDLTDLKPAHSPLDDLPVVDQASAPTCVGHALATVINLQLAKNGDFQRRASPRMLYECAKAHDDIPDQLGAGSTLRGAIKGFFHNGVAVEESPDLEAAPNWALTRDRSRSARDIQLGTYRRVELDFDALHAAIGRTGAVLASARIHAGWQEPVRGRIPHRAGGLGGHAFVIVGYDPTGLIVLNSWGREWGLWRGRPGLAHWSYADAAENLFDAWVVRLAAPSPAVAQIVQKQRAARVTGQLRRADVIGHMLPLSGTGLHTYGKFGFDADIHQETASYLATVGGAARPKYEELALVLHDLPVARSRVAERTARLRALMKPAKQWPVSLMLETALGCALGPIVANTLNAAQDKSGADLRRLDLAGEAGPVVRSLWKRFAQEISDALGDDRPGAKALTDICRNAEGLRLHLVAEGMAGLVAAWLIAHTLKSCRIERLILLGPVLPWIDFQTLILPALTRVAPLGKIGETFPATDLQGFAGTGLSVAQLLADLLGRPFHSFADLPRGREHTLQLPTGLNVPGALDSDAALAWLIKVIGGR